MNITLRHIVYDLLGDFKQLYDDASLTPYKVLFWVFAEASLLKKQHIEKRDSGAFTTIFDVDVHVEPSNGRNYFVLPDSILDMDNDAGVEYITYAPEIDLALPVFASTTFTRTTPAKAARLYFREDELPTPANPYFYRINERIYLLGVEQINIVAVEIGLKLNFNITGTTLSLDDSFEFPLELVPVLKRRVLDLGRFILQIPRDLVNDGAALDSKEMPQQKLISVQPQKQEETLNTMTNGD